MALNAKSLQRELKQLADSSIAEHSQRFFKTGKGEYAEGDKFLGIRVPVLRKTAKGYQRLNLTQVEQLLHSDYHEKRLIALFILELKFNKANDTEQADIITLYLDNTAYINNWDLVDSSAYKILGVYLEDRDKKILYALSQSENLWERRISIISTYQFIKNHHHDDTIKLATLLLNDPHDLIHKAVGWMLREVGNRNRDIEIQFLNKHYKTMPRTMLRYAIEKFPQTERQHYLNKP